MANNCRFAFATHVLSVLALQDGSCSSQTLAETVNTNAVVIRRLLLDLKAAGLVETRRGPGGGAILTRAAQEITLAEIYHAVAGEFQLFGSHPNKPAQCCPVGRGIQVALQGVANQAARCVEREYAAISLQHLVDEIAPPAKKPATRRKRNS